MTAHVDDERERISDTNGTGDARSSASVALADFHVTFRRSEGECQWIARGHSVGNEYFQIGTTERKAEKCFLKGKCFKQSKRLDELFYLPCQHEIFTTNSAHSELL